MTLVETEQKNARFFLKDATADAHAALEAHPLMTRLAHAPTRGVLIDALSRQAGWYAAIEPAIDRRLGHCRPPDMAERRKTPLIRADLAALGVAFDDIPTCDKIPAIVDAEGALGALYVLEGASLGGAILSGTLTDVLGEDVPHRFFDPYGRDRSIRWRRFLDHMEQCLQRPEGRRIAAESALATFESLLAWLEERP